MPSPVQTPARFTPVTAVAFTAADGNATGVATDAPLPVTFATTAAPAPLAGSAAATSVVGPFQPTSARPIVIALSGAWTGQVRVLRSIDGGTTKLPLTVAGSAWAVFTGNACEPVWEEADPAVSFYLDIVLSSGTLTYRVAQ